MRHQIITMPLLNVLIQWIRDRLNEKSNTNHTHGVVTTTQDGFMTSADKTKVDGIPTNPKYTDTVYTHPSTHPASMIEQDSERRMVSDAQIASWNDAVGGGGEPAWGEYGQFKKVMIPEHIIGSQGYGDSDAFWDFVRDEYAHKPGMYVFMYNYEPDGYPTHLYSADGIMVTHTFDPWMEEWMNLDEIGGDSFPINEIPEFLAGMLRNFGGFLWDNFEMAGNPIHVWETAGPRETVYEAGTIMWFENPNSMEVVVFHTLKRDSVFSSGTEYAYQLQTTGQWTRTVGNETWFFGNPYPES